MATKQTLQPWVTEALLAQGPSTVSQIAKHIWEHHEAELRASGDLFFTWQYDMRWAGQVLQHKSHLLKGGEGRTWSLK